MILKMIGTTDKTTVVSMQQCNNKNSSFVFLVFPFCAYSIEICGRTFSCLLKYNNNRMRWKKKNRYI